VLAQLEAQLQQSEGCKSYGEIVQWLEQTLGEAVKYQTVDKTVRYRLGAKLKVPRPRSLKQDEQSVKLFKKTFLSCVVGVAEPFWQGQATALFVPG
jgi:hypothetical protein